LSVAQNNVGKVLRDQGELGLALEAFRQSLAIRERLASADPGNATWQRDLSVAQNNVGKVLRDQGELGLALEAFRQSLAIAERLASADPSNATWQRDLEISRRLVEEIRDLLPE
ncbi:MAG: tetratricopeptide repeat protein, partial [Acidobacteriota bacterium]